MVAATAPSPPAAILDASFVIAYCAKEPNRFARAKGQLKDYANNGWQLFAPGVLVAEALYILCKKLSDAKLTVAEHVQAVQALITLTIGVKPPPHGDSSLIDRAEQIRASYGCSRSADGLYLALAEQLTGMGAAELVTFDDGMEKQARKNAPTVNVKLLMP